ncbi:M20 metallopeptidase family protein [Mycobacterium branderi]|uniref:Amidohydrolase n=1 Tax=Mycobacterium branderi TaxID=43348 RepID=A0A7I7WF46_9MYCO|nr:M20 family metallopeptidase [Mycobacterium branderi]MCV7236336.1 amidohydrolase [Mycobacterium branderi]ORA35500.1 amidohydrolase [Mycobacterium branderi]BBZ15221.1 amidohydrolase [Mycobacterium branderi]
MNLRSDARALQDDLVAFRRDLHREPEVGLHLPRTQERVLGAVGGLPLEIGVGETVSSVTGVLRGGRRDANRPKTVLLRADMDALPIGEQTDEDFASRNGAMHACGHDLHTAALVGAAHLLAAHRDGIAGDVVFMFQPGEEGWDGAQAMIAEGVLDAAGRRVDFAYGMHVLSNTMPAGVFCSKPGPMLSASHTLSVTVRGAGGHGSAPHSAKDPVVAAAEMITSLQTMVTRGFDAFDPVVVTVGVVQAGARANIIPDIATFEATVRRYSAENAERLATLIPRVLQGVAAAHGVEVDVDFHVEYPLTVNNAGEVAFAQRVVQEMIDEDRYAPMDRPLSGSEDFSRVLDIVPGAFVGLGACMPDLDPVSAPMNHSPRARFSDDVLADAAAVYAALAVERLDVEASS